MSGNWTFRLLFGSSPASSALQNRERKACTLEQCAAMIREVGPEAVIVSSDLGQARNPLHPDGLAVFIQGLRRNGFTQPEIDRMTKGNPGRLLELR